MERGKVKRRGKAAQKNVSVYMGRRDEWQHVMLDVVCRYLGMSESELFRHLFFDRMAQWKLYDPEARRPIDGNVRRLREHVRPTTLPDALDDVLSWSGKEATNGSQGSTGQGQDRPSTTDPDIRLGGRTTR